MKKGKWIWYPGDLEIYLANRILFLRDYRGTIEPPFWKIDSPFCNVFFIKEVDLKNPEQIRVLSDAEISIIADCQKGVLACDRDGKYTLPAGKYTITITAYAKNTPVPTVRVDGGVVSDESWYVQLDRYRGESKNVGCSDGFQSPYKTIFKYKDVQPVCQERINGGILYDFGKESFGYIVFHDIAVPGSAQVFYGESREEALATEDCETYDKVVLKARQKQKIDHSRGLRYAYVKGDAEWASVSLSFEYLPMQKKGEFACSSELVNQIYSIAYYTFHLCSRETFLDGLKRDRWYWGGDAYQSFLYNYYTFFDRDICERTLWALRGKDPVTLHINHIMDYTFYWFISLSEYLLYIGNTNFLKNIWPRAITLMDYCLSLRNKEGFLEGRRKEDWVFLDWAPIDNTGVVCAEQLLFVKALRSMAELAVQFSDFERADFYKKEADTLLEKTLSVFYDAEKGVFWHNRVGGVINRVVTRYASVFAVNYKLLDEKECLHTVKSVLEDKDILPIVTPYAKFYEVVSLCEAGKLDEVCKILDDYWGGMIRLGATSFWELYDPAAADHLSMYDRPYGKSLCHAWGSSPLYILGRYFLGVAPLKAGYSYFRVSPKLGSFAYIRGTVPTPTGTIFVYRDSSTIEVENHTRTDGELVLDDGRKIPLGAGKKVKITL